MLQACSSAARPLLDGSEHDVMLPSVGAQCDLST
jgi:hypothetical protein